MSHSEQVAEPVDPKPVLFDAGFDSLPTPAGGILLRISTESVLTANRTPSKSRNILISRGMPKAIRLASVF